MDDGVGVGIVVRRPVHDLRPLSDSAASTPASAQAPRRPMVGPKGTPSGSRCAEMAGARTAECAAVCCCLPCTVLDFVVLTCVKLPAGLCRKAARKRKEKMRKVKTVTAKKSDAAATTVGIEGEAWPAAGAGLSAEEKEMEKEMWEKFYSTGFWRSGSQQDP